MPVKSLQSSFFLGKIGVPYLLSHIFSAEYLWQTPRNGRVFYSYSTN